MRGKGELQFENDFQSHRWAGDARRGEKRWLQKVLGFLREFVCQKEDCLANRRKG